MNRLTERINGEAYVKRYGGLTSICYGCDRVGTCKKKKCGFYHAIEKLAAYEDTGLEPEEIKQLDASDTSKEESIIRYYNEIRKYRDELKHYEDLKEQGLLIKLPCAIGDDLYITSSRVDGKGHVRRLTLTHSNVGNILRRLGNDVFLTREEAEKALKERI